MSSEAVPTTLLEEIEERAALPTTQVTLRQLYEFARDADERTYIHAAQFLHREMPIRFAGKVKELESIPGGLFQVPSIQTVRDWYIESFFEITRFPFPRTVEDDRRFSELVARIKYRHRNQVQVMARGIQEFLRRNPVSQLDEEALHQFLDRFYMSRIGIRVLLGHHTALHEKLPGWSGIICARTAAGEVTERACAEAADLCRRTYGEPPPVRLLGRTNLHFKYIPSHLFHMVFELAKNSFRAVIDHHGERNGGLPPVTIVIAGGTEDVSLKVSDEGGGIPRSCIDKVWNYTYTTANPELYPYTGDDSLMAGMGHGLPLCRLYARYFGGDLQLVSLEGYGTDAYLHLSRLGNTLEAIP